MDTNTRAYIFYMFGGYKGEPSYDEKHYRSGIIRRKIKDTYEYFYVINDKSITKTDLERILKLKIPPNWSDVWISGDPKSDIQAVGLDSKKRKQYKYHEKHIEKADKQKFIRLFDFIKAIPTLEKTLTKHNKLEIYDKNKVIATMLTIVKELHLRVGKEQYAKKNKSYGISSLKKIHVSIDGDIVRFRFKGKSNVKHSYTLYNVMVRDHIKILLKLSGDKLFQYIDDDGNVRKVSDTDLNQYIQQYMGSEFTIKDFRTYGANYYFIKALLSETRKRTPKHKKIMRKNILNALKISAKHLGHTRAISKKSYVMSFCIEMYQDNPDFFINRKYNNVNEVLLEILKLYKSKILHI